MVLGLLLAQGKSQERTQGSIKTASSRIWCWGFDNGVLALVKEWETDWAEYPQYGYVVKILEAH